MSDTYSALRHFADSWMLLLLVLVFLGVVFWAFRPGSRKIHDDTAMVPFRNDDTPGGNE
jgi:cytochrome c oxidase cbb3-type subunit IV